MQYGGEADGINREEFHIMLQNIDGFSEVDLSVGLHKVEHPCLPCTCHSSISITSPWFLN
jgi:hypothetical protein